MKALKLKAVIVAAVIVTALVAGNTMAWFTSTAELGTATFTAGTVKISVTSPVVETEGNQYFNYMNYKVIDFQQGTGINDKNREVPQNDNKAVYDKISKLSTGKPETADFYTMGKNDETNEAYVIIELDKVLPGNDKIRLVECSWGSANIKEKAEVFVRSDNSSWKPVGTVSNTDSKSGDQHPSTIEISADIGDVKYIKIIDATEKSSSDGYDIDYIGVFMMGNEGNWNPGDTNYIAFKINNDGSKDINLRALISGTWGEDGLDDTNVSFELAGSSADYWNDNQDGTFTYKDDINGNYKQTAGSAYLFLKLKLKGFETGNEYQDKTFTLKPTFQAIQASHKGGENGWDWSGFDSYK